MSVFFVLTFALSWACFIGSAAMTRTGSTMTSGLPGVVYVVGVFAPAFVALALTALTGGRRAVMALMESVTKVPSAVHWYAFALGYMISVKLTAALIYRIVMGAWPGFGEMPWYLMVLAIPFSTPAQAGEELGWRGYALPRLAAQIGLAPASIVLGVIWGVWHLPFFFVAGTDKTGQSLPVYVLGTTAISVAMSWLYWKTDGSVLTTMLMHAAINNTTDIVPTGIAGATNPFSLEGSAIAWLTLAVMWLTAAWCLAGMRGVVLIAPAMRVGSAPHSERSIRS
jgi:membrane protease YdiL (CAAX protease family)